MASSINRQVAQVLLRRLKAKDTNHAQAVKLAELIARFQRLPGSGRATPEPPVEPPPPEEKPPESDPLSGLK